jgi:hypothetical protein
MLRVPRLTKVHDGHGVRVVVQVNAVAVAEGCDDKGRNAAVQPIVPLVSVAVV